MEIKVNYVICLVCGHIERVRKALKYVNGNCSHCGVKFIEVYFEGVEVTCPQRFNFVEGELQPTDIECSNYCRNAYLEREREKTLAGGAYGSNSNS